MEGEKEKVKGKPHATVYQNIEYQAWKQQQVYDMKSKAGDQLKIPFGSSPSNEDPSWGMKERESPSSKRKNVSDTSVGTPTLRRQIRGYMSSDCVSPVHSKFSNEYTEGIVQNEPKKSSFMPTSTSTSANNSFKELQLPDSFGSYMEAYKGQYAYPRPNVDPYYGQYYPSMQQPTMAASIQVPQMMPGQPPGFYQPSYLPIYIPVILQPQAVPTMPCPGMSNDFVTGRIKFFDGAQNYGFFTLDCNGSDLFVHYDDFLKAGYTKDHIQMAKAMNSRFAFRRVNYYGKYNLSSKAVDIRFVPETAVDQ